MNDLVPTQGSALQARFEDKGLLPSTRAKYQEIIDSAKGEDLVPWLRSKLRDRTPIGTVLPMRAAVKHYLIAEQGYSEEELRELLPRAQGKNVDLRDALTQAQLALFHASVEELVEKEPAKTILTLLPMTGLRIGEVCSLKTADVPGEDDETLEFTAPSGQQRVVPLVGKAKRLLLDYTEEHQPGEWLFTGYQGSSITAHAIRKYTRKIAEVIPELEGLTPSTLRHTFAMMAIKKGTSLAELKSILGHGSLQTTRRYLK